MRSAGKCSSRSSRSCTTATRGSFFVDQLKAHGPGYISAVAMEEVTLLDYNRTRRKSAMPGSSPSTPSDGTFYFDNPLITLHAPWVTAAQSRGDRVRATGSRRRSRRSSPPGTASGPETLEEAGAPITAATASIPAQPAHRPRAARAAVLAEIKATWHADRKPANVELVVDVSGSMGAGDRLEQAKQGLRSSCASSRRATASAC